MNKINGSNKWISKENRNASRLGKTVSQSFPAGKFGTTVRFKPKLALRKTVCYAVQCSPEVSLWKHGKGLLMARNVCAFVERCSCFRFMFGFLHRCIHVVY
jgi:hypothetical protein